MSTPKTEDAGIDADLGGGRDPVGCGAIIVVGIVAWALVAIVQIIYR